MGSLDNLLGALALPTACRIRRESSNEQPNWDDGNFDQTPLPPGETLRVPLLEGPGVIRHIWMTSHAGGADELNALTLRIWWDGREEPAIEAPLGAFFACGTRPGAVESVPVQVSPTGSLSCYWAMPFRKSARIEVSNDNPDRWAGLYWQVDWTQEPELPPEVAYFHARYRQEYPAAPGDYLIADIEGRGRYVGTVLEVTLAQDGWFGEGDDFFFVDGEDVPSLQGTGTEDYFNDAWGFRRRTGLWFGQTHWQGYEAGDHGVAYRWHVLDPISFDRSLRFRLEHKGNLPLSEDGFFVERPDYLSSVAFWYQTGQPKPFGHLPPWPERVPPWERRHLLRSLRKASVTGGPAPTVTAGGLFGGRPALAWQPTTDEAELALPFEVGEPGRRVIRLAAFAGPDGGTFAASIDGQPCEVADLQAEEGTIVDLRLGVLELDAGAHTLRLRPRPGRVGALVVEQLSLLRLPPPASRPVKTHNEAHFVRLAIGRATYAFRLAWDRLPSGLQELVDAGLLEDRHLRDENGRPMESRTDGVRLVVEAAEWTHSWRGTDARS
ncbi:MAG TPA: glycoside hydrolase family 172 protein [Chthonomonadales bacterium]|nr:glycoside hydrolase family 172 protein [Chthonomonadales bacterium]